MNIYVFNADAVQGSYGVAVVYAHTADEARKLLDATAHRSEHFKPPRTIVLGRNPKAQIVASYFE